VFTASTESLQAVADDDDLMNAFFGDESNNLDEFIEARSGVPKPVETEEVETEDEVVEAKGSIWEPTTTTISIAGGPGGEKQQSEYPTFKLRDDIPEMYKDEKIRGQAMAKMTQDINEYNSNISKIDENLAQIESAMKGLSGASLEKVKAHRKKITIKRQSLEKELKDIQSKYDYLKEPEPEIVVK
jgi:chromosome segregation ATPase